MLSRNVPLPCVLSCFQREDLPEFEGGRSGGASVRGWLDEEECIRENSKSRPRHRSSY